MSVGSAEDSGCFSVTYCQSLFTCCAYCCSSAGVSPLSLSISSFCASYTFKHVFKMSSYQADRCCGTQQWQYIVLHCAWISVSLLALHLIPFQIFSSYQMHNPEMWPKLQVKVNTDVTFSLHFKEKKYKCLSAMCMQKEPELATALVCIK